MVGTLLLNRGYEPLCIITLKRALKLLMKGRCEIVQEYDWPVRAPSMEFRAPAVVRLLVAFSRKFRTPSPTRKNIYARDKHVCCYCGKKFAPHDLNLDHVIPRSHGGTSRWENLVSSCLNCNSHKANRTPQQAGMTMHYRPVVPKWRPALQIRLTSTSLPDEWASWIYWNAPLEE